MFNTIEECDLALVTGGKNEVIEGGKKLINSIKNGMKGPARGGIPGLHVWQSQAIKKWEKETGMQAVPSQA
ncbi:MAG: hypothetical protein AB7P03_17575 [Kofleriaceae bacterium]